MDKKSFWKGFIVGCILSIISLIVVYNLFTVQPDVSLNQVEVFDLDGNKVNLNEYTGKPLVVNFWATWCAPCIAEFPYFDEAKQDLGSSVNFVVISDEIPEKIIAFSESKPYGFEYLRSSKDLREYGITIRPTTYFYNAKGELITKHTGNLDRESLKELIKKTQ